MCICIYSFISLFLSHPLQNANISECVLMESSLAVESGTWVYPSDVAFRIAKSLGLNFLLCKIRIDVELNDHNVAFPLMHHERGCTILLTCAVSIPAALD